MSAYRDAHAANRARASALRAEGARLRAELATLGETLELERRERALAARGPRGPSALALFLLLPAAGLLLVASLSSGLLVSLVRRGGPPERAR